MAIKWMADALSADPAYVERFRREARIAAQLSHPGLVRVLDAGTENGRPYLVMDHVAGPTLADLLDEGPGAVDPERVARELLGALGHVHAAGIVHRDVKPANVLVGEDGRALLTDFGIALSDDAVRLTATGNLVGTIRYVAPELVSGAPATPRSDLYSLGVVLGELEPAPGSPVAGLVQELTAVEPGARPASAEAALERLDAAARGAPEPTRRLPVRPRAPAVAPAPAPRRRTGVLVALVILLVLAAAVLLVVLGG